MAKNFMRNRLVLNQTETAFVDFKRKNFPEQARDIYDRLYQGNKRRDKVDLMKTLSVPLYDVFKVCLKDENRLPFPLYKNVVDVSLVQARLYSLHKMNMNPSQTWHQITMKFTYEEEGQKKEIVGYNVFERRECDPSPFDWRICHIE